MKITGKAQILIYFFLFKMSLRADSRLRGRLDFGCMKRCDFWRAKRAENFPHNPTCFPHNQHFLPHNVPENFRTICYFFPHPIRCPVYSSFILLTENYFVQPSVGKESKTASLGWLSKVPKQSSIQQVSEEEEETQNL